MEEPAFPIVVQLEDDISANEAVWNTYESFKTELDSLSEQDWIGFKFVFCDHLLNHLTVCITVLVLDQNAMFLRTSWDSGPRG